MEFVLYSSAIAAFCLFLAVLIRRRSQKMANARIKKSIMKNSNMSVDEIEEMFQEESEKPNETSRLITSMIK